jgi:hypothetical protein
MRELTGFKDHQDTPIREGDIIEFWIDPDRGYSLSAAPGYTHMTDTVKFVDEAWYFWDEDINAGGLAATHAHACAVIGNIHDAAMFDH